MMPDTGSWPDWIGASVALIALVVAAVAAWATIKTNQAQSRAIELQRLALEDVQTQRKREQADRFMVWYQDGAYNFANLSDKPIFGVTLVANLENDPARNELIFKLDRSTELPNPILPDGTTHRLSFASILVPLSIYFSDARGTTWRIDEHPEATRTPEEVTRHEVERVLESYPFYLSQDEMLEILENPEAHRH